MPKFQLRHVLIGSAAFLASAGAASAQDVQAGIAAWQAGDYANAVAVWRPLADRGDADAQFNLGQAYRLGRGLPQNLNLAEQWFERAARQRHEQAGASLGLLLFQNGRAREAMPWLQAAALRGDPRAQYVFGTALFNGDVVRRDLPRAYALMKMAAGQGFPQAQSQLAQMEQQLSAEDRARGEVLAAEMAGPSAPQTELASAEQPSVPGARDEAPQPPEEATQPREGQPDAGVSYEHPPESGYQGPPPSDTRRPAPPVQRPAPVRAETVRPRPPRPAPVTTRTVAPPTPGGSWRVQLGAFSSDANARRQWAQLRRRVSALGSLQPSYQRAGPLVRLRTGPVGSRAAAERVCSAVRAAGEGCVLVP